MGKKKSPSDLGKEIGLSLDESVLEKPENRPPQLIEAPSDLGTERRPFRKVGVIVGEADLLTPRSPGGVGIFGFLAKKLAYHSQ